MANNFFLNGEVLFKRTPDLGLLRCVDAAEATKLLEEVHAGVCTRRSDQSTAPRAQCDEFPLAICTWGMDVIGPIEPAASNGHRFILVAIDYFTKWVEAASYKAVTKKVATDFVRNNLMNGVVEAANKNIKRIVRKMIDNYKCWHENLPYALLGYRTTIRTSTGVTPYLLVYGTKAVIPAEVEIPSLRIIQKAGLSDAEWVRDRYEQLTLIDEKRMSVVCNGQLYQQRMTRAFNKKVRVRTFKVSQLVLKRIFPHQDEYKGKFAPNWQGPYVVHKVLSRGALFLAEVDGRVWRKAINSDAVKRYYI
ncbi:uncharacterized protein LOC125823617 [Solanum verrucosum]|uniref:uncharacterized protein LOC125823617 n=1 Tax=Solanum verrucosum TaxID=315347 RepID=UPI0020D04D19|nr:uncharacterized protein LOC125823617 [Solanum verrucosum]